VFLDRAEVEEFRRRVAEWYEVYGSKDLPWRRTREGWAVLVAAFLLRRISIAQISRVYEELLERWPSPQHLLSASEDEVKSVIRSLGIEHQRARHLIELARILVQRFGGRVPCERERLEELPGVGDYIASEVLLRACDRPEPLLDRNMIRVLERVFGVKSSRKRPHTDPAL
jgi:A/G-specific adenine glycosylase